MPHCACLGETALRKLASMYICVRGTSQGISALCMSADMKIVRHADFIPMVLRIACMHSHIHEHVSSRSEEGLVEWMPVYKHVTASAAVY